MHEPSATKVTVVPETVQKAAFAGAKVTVKPLDAVADRVKVPVPKVLFESDPKVIV